MDRHATHMAEALALARTSDDEGGLPIGSVLVRGDRVIGRGHNRRVQDGDPIAHGEMDCLRNAGRQRTYRDTVIYTTLSPCMMCSGTIVQFGIPTVVIGESVNFAGNKPFLEAHGVTVVDLGDPACIELMARFVREHPALWNEDIAAD